MTRPFPKPNYLRMSGWMAVATVTVLMTSCWSINLEAQDDPASQPSRPRPERSERAEGGQRGERTNRLEGGDQSDRAERLMNRREVGGAVDEKRREELRKFVQENLPEMERMLTVLSRRQAPQFQRAIVSLDESYSRLKAIENRGNEAQYQIALENWKLDARIKMLTAELSYRDNPELENRLKRLVNRQIELRVEQLQNDRLRLQRQLERIEGNLSRLENDRQTEVDRRVKAILRSTERVRVAQEESQRKREQDDQRRSRPQPKSDQKTPSQDKESDDAHSELHTNSLNKPM